MELYPNRVGRANAVRAYRRLVLLFHPVLLFRPVLLFGLEPPFPYVIPKGLSGVPLPNAIFLFLYAFSSGIGSIAQHSFTTFITSSKLAFGCKRAPPRRLRVRRRPPLEGGGECLFRAVIFCIAESHSFAADGLMVFSPRLAPLSILNLSIKSFKPFSATASLRSLSFAVSLFEINVLLNFAESSLAFA